MSEIWKDINGYEELYQVSDCGRVKSVQRKVKRTNKYGTTHTKIINQRILKGRPCRRGHMTVQLCKNNKSKNFQIHRLVLEAFIGPCPQGLECCHNDGNPKNNKQSNLRWDTKSSNRKDSVIHGSCNFQPGINHPNAKLTEDDVVKIREMYATKNYSHIKLGKMFNAGAMTISAIVNRRTWIHVA